MEKTLIPLHRVAYTRSGDKGDISNIGIIAFTPELYQFLKVRITPELVRAHFKGQVKGSVTIYPMDNIESLEVVMRGALGGGATKTLRYDQTGKSMAALAQSIPVPFGSNELALIPDRPPVI
jgi:hypothetical protein